MTFLLHTGAWLTTYAAQIQAVASIAAVGIAAVVGWVAWKQKLAAEAQARAAGKQTAAAEAQAEAAKEQVTAAKQQTAASLAIADKQTSPNIFIFAPTLSGAIVRNGIGFRNVGSGPALKMTIKYLTNNIGDDDVRLPVKMLTAGESTDVVIDVDRAVRFGLRLAYETMFGTKYALEFQWNGNDSSAINQNLFVISDE